MKHGWEYKKFTDVCDVQYGFAFDSKFFTDDENAMPLIRIRDVMRGYSETFYNGEIPNGYLINEGDYLVGMDGEFNIGRWGKRPGLLNQRVCKMSSSSKLLDNQYMYYFMKVCLKSIEDETPFVTVKHLSAKRINLIKIPLPPLLTQQSIASELDKINELIRLKKEQLKDYDNLAQSIFYEMFGDPVENEKGWEVKKLGELCVSKLKYGSGASAVDFDGNIRYVRITDINEDGTLNNDIKSPNIVDDEYLLNVGDIVFARSGATVGKTYLHRKNNIKCLYAGYLIKATLNTKMALPIYVFQFTQSKYYKDWVNLNARAVAQPNINAKQYGDLQIPLPPLTLQQLFAKRIELIEQQKAEIQTTIADLETLLASRMQYWFD